VVLIAALGEAAAIARQEMPALRAHLGATRDRLLAWHGMA
jgi:hypothetical protein